MSDEFDSPDVIEKAAVETELNRCRVLAAKIANELRNKKPEHFVDRWFLADIHSSLERAADVLSTLKDSQARWLSRLVAKAEEKRLSSAYPFGFLLPREQQDIA